MRRLAILAMVVLALAACQPEPKMTITATAPRSSVCGQDFLIEGKVTPGRATLYVVLQIKRGGKWVDWEWWDYYDTQQPTFGGWIDFYPFSDGYYWMQPRTPLTPGTTYAFRVRSAGSSAVSPTFYHKVVAPPVGSCPRSLWTPLAP